MEILFCHTSLCANGEKEPLETQGKSYEVIRRMPDGAYLIKNDWGFPHKITAESVNTWFSVAGRPNYDRLKNLLGWLYESACQGEKVEPHIEKEIRHVLGLDLKGDPFKLEWKDLGREVRATLELCWGLYDDKPRSINRIIGTDFLSAKTWFIFTEESYRQSVEYQKYSPHFNINRVDNIVTYTGIGDFGSGTLK